MVKSGLCHSFAGRSKEFLTTCTSIRPFSTKEVIDISLGIGVFFRNKGLEWIRDFITIQRTPALPQVVLYTLHKSPYHLGLSQRYACRLSYIKDTKFGGGSQDKDHNQP
jgi:hypothetical protein